MRTVLIISGVILLLSTAIFAQDNLSDNTNNWPQWRGPFGTGAAPLGNPPVEWNETKNIRWKTRLPGTGFSTPAVWGNDIYLTAAISTEIGIPSPMSVKYSEPVKFLVLAVDRLSGKIKWERLAREEVPHEGMHKTSAWASSSPCTDGERVYAFYGSRGLYCYTTEGDLIWEKDFGNMRVRLEHGEASSPALYKDRLIINWDHEGQSFITALDTATGEEIWRKNRDENTSWATPLIVEVAGQPQIIQCATNHVRSYNLADGELIWEDDGLTVNAIPSPVAADGVVYVTSGFRGNALRAIRLSLAKGNITGTPAVLWSYNQDTPYVPSALLHRGALYFLKSNQGILTCIDIETGKPYYSNQRLDGIRTVYASPVGVADRIYLSGREGTTLVIRHGAEFGIIATNTLDDKIDASPVIVGDELFLRGHQYLYCIAE